MRLRMVTDVACTCCSSGDEWRDDEQVQQKLRRPRAKRLAVMQENRCDLSCGSSQTGRGG